MPPMHYRIYDHFTQSTDLNFIVKNVYLEHVSYDYYFLLSTSPIRMSYGWRNRKYHTVHVHSTIGSTSIGTLPAYFAIPYRPKIKA